MTNPGIYHLFVYGSLRRGFRTSGYEYISCFFNPVADNVKVKGKLVDMGSYPAGVPCDDNHFIVGELFVAKNENEFSWAIGQLDDYEGVSVEFDEIQLYRRDIVEVMVNEKKVPAWIYWYQGDTNGRPAIASGDMIEYFKQKK